MNAGTNSRPPRGALAVVAIGLVATVAAALLSTEKPTSSTALSWETGRSLAASTPAALPGGGRMQIADAGIRVSEANSTGYRLYRVAAVLTIDPGSVVGGAKVQCAMRVPALRTLLAHTTEDPAAFPLPNSEEGLLKQAVPATVTIEFNAHSSELAQVEFGDAFKAFVNAPGVIAGWPSPRPGQQSWEWTLPRSLPAKPLRLGFAAIWRTTGIPAARISCATQSAAGHANVATGGAVPGLS